MVGCAVRYFQGWYIHSIRGVRALQNRRKVRPEREPAQFAKNRSVLCRGIFSGYRWMYENLRRIIIDSGNKLGTISSGNASKCARNDKLHVLRFGANRLADIISSYALFGVYFACQASRE
jgi:hypothetical protein